MAKLRKLALLFTTILMMSVLVFASACYSIDDTSSGGSSVADSSTPDVDIDDSSTTPDPVTYTITFVNHDGEELEVVTIEEGETPVYSGELPVKESSVEKDYTFDGWNPILAPASADVTYTAVFAESARKYTITWKNADGSELASEQVAYGEVPVYEGTPAMDQTVSTVYTFAGWDVDPAAVTGDAVYTATYTETARKYSVVLVKNNGEENVSFEVDYGTEASVLYTMIPEKVGNTFTGWFVGETKVENSDIVDRDLVITAGWEVNNYAVKFVNDDDSVLHSVELPYGEVIVYTATPSKEASESTEYTFAGWTPAFENGVTTVPVDGITFKATYTETARKYLVKFLNNDGSELASSQVEYGTVPSFEGTPAYVGFSIFEHAFKAWDAELVEVIGEATYTATYEVSGTAEIATIDALNAGVWECMGANGDGTYYICGAGRQFGWNAGNFVEAQNGIGISNALVMQAKEAGYNYLEVAVKATNWFSVSNKPVYNAWATTNQEYCDMAKPEGDYIVIDLSNIEQTNDYTLLATCSNVVHVMNARFVNTPVTENVDFASILYCYAANENGNGNSPNGAITKYIDNNNGKGGMYWAQNSKAGIQKYLGTNLVREPENYSADVGFMGTTDLGNGATVYLKDHVGDTNSGNPTVEQALASGMSKLVVTVYVSNVDAKVYYWDKAKEWEANIESEGALATIDENGFATVTIDISEFDAANANYLTLPYLKGNNGDWMAYMSIKFAK